MADLEVQNGKAAEDVGRGGKSPGKFKIAGRVVMAMKRFQGTGRWLLPPSCVLLSELPLKRVLSSRRISLKRSVYRVVQPLSTRHMHTASDRLSQGLLKW